MQAHRRGENDDVSHPFLHPSALPTIGDSQINFVTLIPVIDAIFHSVESCLQIMQAE